MKRIGFWKDTFLDPLPDPRRLVDRDWDPATRTVVLTYLRAGREAASYFGYAHCRFECGKPDGEMGNKDLTDGVYLWPEGYAHYVQDHLVRPPDDFVAHVMRKKVAP